jgi:hypothetical protein
MATSRFQRPNTCSTTLCGVVSLFSVMVFGCKGEEWGTPEYFERIVGVKFTPAAPVMRCTDNSVPGVLAFHVVQLPPEVGDLLRDRGAALQGFPRQLSSERARKLQPWTHGALSDQAREALELSLTGAATAIEHSTCRTMKSEQVVQQIRSTLARETTWYSYEFKPTEGRVSSDELQFRVLDPIGRVLYELINFS